MKYLILVAIALTHTLPAIAGNSRSFFLGDEAALTAGAGIAVSADSGSLWYNPAGLGGLKLGRMELTGTVYSAKLRKLDDLLKADVGSGVRTTSVRADDFGSVPTALVFVRNANDKISYGLAWYQTTDAWFDIRADLQAPIDSNGMTWLEGVEYHQRAYVYHIGPSVGIQLHPRFRIGASLYFVYSNFNGSLRAFAGAEDGDDTTADDTMVSRSVFVSRMDLGLMLSAGIQWQVSDNWHLGLVLRTPTFRVWVSSNASDLNAEASVNTAETGEVVDAISSFSYLAEKDTSMTFKQTVPMEADLGVVYKKGRSWLGAEVAVRPPLASADQKTLWNASLGGRLALNDVLSWGAGIFTDNSSKKSSADTLNWKSDRYGFATGLEFRTPLLVKQSPEEIKSNEKEISQGKDTAASGTPKPKKERTLTWATTIVVSYSFELAEYQSIVVDSSREESLYFENQHGVFHQGLLYLGTALYF